MAEIRKSSHIRTSTRRPGQKLTKEETAEKQEIFLHAFSSTANVRAACMKAGIDRSTVRQWEEHDETFNLRYNEAKLDADDLIRAELWRRGTQGYEKPVVGFGKVVYGQDGKPLMERVYSDQLLMFIARARMPEYRDKQHLDVTANIAGSTQTDISAYLKMLTDEQLAQFKSWLREAETRQG